MATQNWPGASGTVYEYEVFSFGETWSDVPGNYIFARLETVGFARKVRFHPKSQQATRKVQDRAIPLC